MQGLLSWLSQIFSSWRFWIVIAPWEIGVRVRLGKNARALNPGPHLRIPFIDVIVLVNTRLRINGTPPITVAGSLLNRARYISAVVGFRIADPVRAMLKFGMPESAVITKAQGEIALLKDARLVEKAMGDYFDADSGIVIEFISFVEDLEVRTYRLLSQGSWTMNGHETLGPNGEVLARY